MPLLKLTKRSIDAIDAPAARPEFYWDTELRGFGMKIDVSGRKSFVCRLKRSGLDKRTTIGTFERITVDQARTAALGLLSQAKRGVDPTIKIEVERLTVEQLFEQWMRARARSQTEDQGGL